MSTSPIPYRLAEPHSPERDLHVPSFPVTSALRVLFVILVLVIEAIIPNEETARPLHFVANGGVGTILVQQIGGRIRYFGLVFVAMTVFLSWRSFREHALDALKSPSNRRPVWMLWLLLNLTFSLALIGAVPALTSLTSSANVEAWFALRIAMATGAFATGALALMPASFWRGWYTSCRRAFLWGFLLGLAVQLVGFVADMAWDSAALPTFWAAAWGLRLLGKPVVVDPDNLRIGIPGFRARILPSCSGIEGLGLVITFLSFYLWWFRDQLRMPRALILLPIGVVAGWILNVVRIDSLILIGAHNRAIALGGFHSAAGWILFNALCFGIVAASWKFESLSTVPANVTTPRVDAAFYLVPLLAIAATGMITHALTVNFDFLYPMRVIAGAIALYFFRDRLAAMRWRPSLEAIGLGAAVFVVWVAFARGGDAGSAGFISGMREMTKPQSALWLTARIFGATVTVPIAEELAFRGYLMRKMTAADFESVGFSQCSWFAAIVSSILFGVLHNQYVAGTIAGMLFAYAMYRRGSLSSAIYAHATANALLAAYVLMTGRWSLWE